MCILLLKFAIKGCFAGDSRLTLHKITKIRTDIGLLVQYCVQICVLLRRLVGIFVH